MNTYRWDQTFLELFDRCVAAYRDGNEDFESYYTADDRAFLDSIGYRTREFFDFVEDHADSGDPTPASALMVASARRDYFQVIQGGTASNQVTRPEDLPARDAQLGDIPWLPRIIVKAEAKLRGELDPDIMYGCGGDRAFLHHHDIHPAEFLRTVWAADGDHDRILDFIRS